MIHNAPIPAGIRRRATSGFSLVEVSLALGIISFSLTVMVALFGNILKVRGDNVNRAEAFRAITALQAQLNEPGAFSEVYGWVKAGSKELVFVRHRADASGTPNAVGERYRAQWLPVEEITPAMQSAMDGRWIKARLNWDNRSNVNSMEQSDLPANVNQYPDAQATLVVKLFPVPNPQFNPHADTPPALTTTVTLTR